MSYAAALQLPLSPIIISYCTQHVGLFDVVGPRHGRPRRGVGMDADTRARLTKHVKQMEAGCCVVHAR